MIDRLRLATLRAVEEARFVEQHPLSAALAEEQRRTLLAGVPMPWMTRWPGSFPVSVAEARGGRLADVDGLEYADLCLGDTGAMAGARSARGHRVGRRAGGRGRHRDGPGQQWRRPA